MFSLKSIFRVGGLTLVSRALGFLREMMMARLLGTGPVAEAFVVAMRLPNLFRQMFAEGAFNSAFVPIFARHLEGEGRDGAKIFAEQVLAFLLVVLLIVTLAAQMAMPWLIRVFAFGFIDYPEKYRMAVVYTIITFPYLLFMSLAALHGGILNTLGRFGPPAAAPILLNIAMIATLVFVAPRVEDDGAAIAWTVPVAGFLQFLWLVAACRRSGMALRLRWPRLTAEVKRFLKLMVPGLLAGGVNQINLTIATILASLQAGAVAYLGYADRLYQLPLALIGSAIGVVLLPSLARAIRAGRREEADRIQNRAIEFGLILALPACVILVVAAEPVIAALYQRGAFSAADSAATAAALVAVALGLPAYVLNKALSPGFLAREDTLSPFRFALIGVASDIAIALALFPFFGYVGIAFGTAGAAWINSALLFSKLRHLGHLPIDARLKRNLPRLLAAAAAMAAALVAWRYFDPLPAVATSWGRLRDLALLTALGFAVYGAGLFVFRALAWRDFKRALTGVA